jgi:preprotein translocase subunit YajC
VEQLLPFVLLASLAIFYFVMIRSARSRQREAVAVQSRLATGLEVMTTSGLYGRVVGVDDEAVTLETSPGVTSRWARAAIARIVSPEGSTTAIDGDGDRTDDNAAGGSGTSIP